MTKCHEAVHHARTHILSTDEAKTLLDMGFITPISAKTSVTTGYEYAFMDCLRQHRIKTYYEPFIMHLNVLHEVDHYVPDFVTELRVDGKRVIIEPHSMSTLTDDEIHIAVDKYHRFRLRYGDGFYLIIASTISKEALNSRMNNRLPAFCDEYWLVQNSMPDPIRHAKDSLNVILEEFLRRV